MPETIGTHKRVMKITLNAKIHAIPLHDFTIGGNQFVVIAGPCVIEQDSSIVFQTAEQLQNITKSLQVPYIFKASYDKANRSSLSAYRGVGLEKGLDILEEVKQQFGLPILTDVHSPAEAHIAAEVADILQIPAFLCRQTDLLVAAAKTGKIVNIKKGQFLAPADIEHCIRKVTESGNKRVLVTERGFAFGYGNLVSDMRAIPMMQRFGYPVIFDATHSVQLPGGAGGASSGERQFVETLARSAVAAGANGLFLEVHPQPDLAPCDGPNMITPDAAKALLTVCQAIFHLVHR